MEEKFYKLGKKIAIALFAEKLKAIYPSDGPAWQGLKDAKLYYPEHFRISVDSIAAEVLAEIEKE